jgi:hypothetical protein
MTITILEGPDGSGKTTLLNQLAGHASGLAFHSTPDPTLDGHQKFEKYLAWLRSSDAGNLYADRAWLSCLIYDQLCEKPRLTTHHRRILERLALSVSAVQVICLPPYEICREHWSRRLEQNAEYVLDESVFRRIYTAYESEALSSPRMATILYNWRGGHESVLPGLLNTMRPEPNLGPGVGRWKPGCVTLLVGDRPTSNADVGPFCSMIGCSPWLSEQLEQSGIREMDLYFVNAYDLQGLAIDPRFVDRLRPKAIVALGNQATAWCTTHGLEHVKVPHPQSWRRFHAAEPYPLVAELLKRLEPVKLGILTHEAATDRVLH